MVNRYLIHLRNRISFWVNQNFTNEILQPAPNVGEWGKFHESQISTDAECLNTFIKMDYLIEAYQPQFNIKLIEDNINNSEIKNETEKDTKNYTNKLINK